MAGADEARQAVETAGQRCGEAEQACETARTVAERRVAWAAEMGLTAVAAVMRQAATALAEAAGAWRATAGACTTASTAVATAGQTTNLDTALSHLTAAADRLNTEQAAVATDRAHTGAERAGHTEIADTTRTALAAVEAGARAATVLEGARRAVEDYREQVIAAARAVGGGSPSSGQPPAPPRPGIPGFTHRRPAREAVEAIRREGWPTNDDGRISARGNLYDGDGVPVNDTVIRAHRKGQAPPCDELLEPWRSDPEYTTTWHAERDAAKMMRDRHMDHAVLYLNIPPCGRYSEDNRRCDANLEKVIPAGSTLWVWTLSETGTLAQRRFRGTGEAIR